MTQTMENDFCSRAFRVGAVLFDFDDTLTAPGALDFELIRTELGCPAKTPILEYIAALPTARGQRRAYVRLAELEAEAAARAVPNPSATQVVHRLIADGLPAGIITRNGRAAVERALENFPDLSAEDFQVIVSRDDHVAPKPSPQGVLLAADRLGVDASELMMVGDFVFDILAGSAAGAITVLLRHGDLIDAGYGSPPNDDPVSAGSRPSIGILHPGGDLDPRPDFTIAELADLPAIVRLGRPLPAGKFPGDLLDRFLATLPTAAHGLVLGPHVGRDVAVIDPLVGHETAGKAPSAVLMAVSVDPITFVTDDLARWGVLVNANDIATCGGRPRWFFSTVLFPVSSTPSQVLKVLGGLRDACRRHGIALSGGHTEITDAVRRPVVSGTMLGMAGELTLVDKHSVRAGDALILTKRVAVEGTALLAAELGDSLRARGMSPEEVATCLLLREQLAVTDEARVAAAMPGVSGMHDVTEGGLATAVAELSSSSGHSLAIDVDAIPVFDETRKVCALLGVDPLGLIGSGSLLITCAQATSDPLLHALADGGIEATIIGSVGQSLSDGEAVVNARRGGEPWAWPRFDVDEVARVLGDASRVP